jgi:hypothetical protein
MPGFSCALVYVVEFRTGEADVERMQRIAHGLAI